MPTETLIGGKERKHLSFGKTGHKTQSVAYQRFSEKAIELVEHTHLRCLSLNIVAATL